MPRLILGFLFCLLPLLAQAQTEQGAFEGLGTEMTPEEQTAAGLGELSTDQQEYLDTWLRKRFGPKAVAGGSPVITPVEPQAEMAAVPEGGAVAQENAIEAEVERRVAAELAAVKAAETRDEEALNEPFEATLTSSFSGWSGKTVFALDNGQVWRQRTGSSRYRHTRGDNKVRFKRSFMGLWTMTVLSTGRSVGVRRID